MKTFLFVICVQIFVVISTKAQCINADFELTTPGTYSTSNAVSGWTVSSQTASSCANSTVWVPGSPEFSILYTPIIAFPTIGTIPNSPLGGQRVANLNNSSANGNVTKLSQTFTVTNIVLNFAFAGYWQSGTHQCCEQSYFLIQVKDSAGVPIPCGTFSINGNASNCPSIGINYSVTTTSTWANWQTKYVDLCHYVGKRVTIEVTCKDCIYGDHYGSLFFDCTTQYAVPSCGSFQNPIIFNNGFCLGSSIATLAAPLGFYSYSWEAPVGYPITPAQSTLSAITLTNALANNVYTLNVTLFNGCQFTNLDTLVNTSVNINGLGSTSTCVNGTSGSATVSAVGSSTGYNYSWINSTNSVVATTPVVTNLTAGVYSILVTATGPQSLTCGSYMNTVSIVVGPYTEISLLKGYCGNEAYMCTTGTSIQWYNGMSPITSSLGAAPCLTITNPTNGGVYRVVSTSAQGCRDSLAYTLLSTPPGTMNVTSPNFICQGAINGSVAVSLISSFYSPPGSNFFSVFSTGPTPLYTSSVNPTSLNTYTATGMQAGTYSVIAFDGTCKYQSGFTIVPYIFNYSLNPASSTTVCSGNAIAAGINFPTPPGIGEFTFSWSPTIFLAGGNGGLQSTIIIPSVSSGSASTVVYTVVVTPTLVNCPITKTLAITTVTLLTATVSTIPGLCSNSSSYTIQVNPGGGIFSNNAGVSPVGLISPSNTIIGLNTFSYYHAGGSCPSAAQGTFMVYPPLNLTISGNSNLCIGNSGSLSASGAVTYSWSNGTTGSLTNISPTITSTYTLTGFSNAGNCSVTKNITVTVVPLPQISINGSSTLCADASETLIATGANTYLWNSITSGSSIVISPTWPTTYSVIGTNSLSCSNSASISVSLYPNPQLNLVGYTDICPNEIAYMSVTGAESYSWSTGGTNTFAIVSPAVSTTYTVTGTNSYGCSTSLTHLLLVNDCTALNEQEEELSELSFYPNPASSFIHIDSKTELHFELRNAQSLLIQSGVFLKGTNKLDLQSLADGLYYLILKSDASNKSFKIIKTAD